VVICLLVAGSWINKELKVINHAEVIEIYHWFYIEGWSLTSLMYLSPIIALGVVVVYPYKPRDNQHPNLIVGVYRTNKILLRLYCYLLICGLIELLVFQFVFETVITLALILPPLIVSIRFHIKHKQLFLTARELLRRRKRYQPDILDSGL
jgi:hypothetical protein